MVRHLATKCHCCFKKTRQFDYFHSAEMLTGSDDNGLHPDVDCHGIQCQLFNSNGARFWPWTPCFSNQIAKPLPNKHSAKTSRSGELSLCKNLAIHLPNLNLANI